MQTEIWDLTKKEPKDRFSLHHGIQSISGFPKIPKITAVGVVNSLVWSLDNAIPFS